MFLRPIENDKWCFYAVCEDDGTCSLLEFLYLLGAQYNVDRNKLLVMIEKGAANFHGLQLLPKEISHIINKRHKIYQLTARNIRLLYFYSEHERKVVICSHAFTKGSKKTPVSEIQRAIAVKKKYTGAFKTNNIKIVENDTKEGK